MYCPSCTVEVHCFGSASAGFAKRESPLFIRIMQYLGNAYKYGAKQAGRWSKLKLQSPQNSWHGTEPFVPVSSHAVFRTGGRPREISRLMAKRKSDASADAVAPPRRSTRLKTTQPTTIDTAPEQREKPVSKPKTPQVEPVQTSSDKQYWLLKAEPETRLENGVDVRFSIDDLAAKTTPEPWDGEYSVLVRNTEDGAHPVNGVLTRPITGIRNYAGRNRRVDRSKNEHSKLIRKLEITSVP